MFFKSHRCASSAYLNNISEIFISSYASDDISVNSNENGKSWTCECWKSFWNEPFLTPSGFAISEGSSKMWKITFQY